MEEIIEYLDSWNFEQHMNHHDFEEIEKHVKLVDLTEDDIIQILNRCYYAREQILDFLLPKITLEMIVKNSEIFIDNDFAYLQEIEGFNLDFILKVIELRNDIDLCKFIDWSKFIEKDEDILRLPIKFLRSAVELNNIPEDLNINN